MNFSVNRGRKLPLVLVLLSILTLLVVPGARAGATAATQDQNIPPDLAAMALTPADLEQAGLVGFGVASVDADSSGWRMLGDVAVDSIAGNYWLSLQTPEPINVGLAQAGWQRQYRRVLAQPDPLDPGNVNLSVRSEVGEYADADGADAALTLLMDGGSSESPGAQPIGDRLEVRTDLDPNVGARLVVAFREGNLIESVEIVRYASAEDPELEPALLLARQLQARIDSVITAQSPRLGDAALRLSTLAGPAEYEGYARRGGETFIWFGELAEDFAARDAALSDAVDVYQLEQQVAPASQEVVPPYFIDRLYRFADEAAARAFIDQTPQKLADDTANSGGEFSAVLVEGATAFGDNSLTFEIQDEIDAGTAYGYRIYVQVGSDIGRMQLDSSNGISIDAAEAIAAAQTACLEAGSCLAAEQSPVSLPGIDCPPTHTGELLPNYPATEFAPVSMFGADPARSGAHPGPSPSGNLQEDWEVTVHGGTSYGPVISDGVIVFGSSETIESDDLFSAGESDYFFAFDPAAHEFMWCVPTGSAIADPSIDGGLVFTQANAVAGRHVQTFVVALDTATGIERWRFPIGTSMAPYESAVTAANGIVYVTTGFGAVFALNETTGFPLWLHQVDQDVDMGDLALSYPAIDGDVVYVSGGSVLYALSANSGEELWSVQADDESEILGTPSVADGFVYVGGKYAIYAVDALTGSEQWVTDVDSPDVATLAVASGVVYATFGHEFDSTTNGYAIGFDAQTGSQIWRLDFDGGFVTSPAVVGNIVYVGTGGGQDEATLTGNVYALSAADGSVLTSYPLDGKANAPVVSGGFVYIGTTVVSEEGENGMLYAIGGDSAAADETPILDRKSG
jgi:outer membrane protein assembly factor BamB